MTDQTDQTDQIEGDASFEMPAELIGHPARSAMLRSLLDGRALPMSMLASEAGVAASTASEHLTKLTKGGLLRVRPEGRRRYYELASSRVADALEALSRLAPRQPVRSLRADTRARALRLARTCYDHLAGQLGVEVMQSLLSSGMLAGGTGEHIRGSAGSDRLAAPGRDVGYWLTPDGRSRLDDFGVRVRQTRRPLVRYCVDLTEQRHHLGGSLGAGLLQRFEELDWLRPGTRPGQRALTITPAGEHGFAENFGIDTGRLAIPGRV
ncbi:MAG TPA: helix-turn-helix domain-containing protein [Streptosporangiaceae bacterium]|nr:helix-turn-helix domain-containing protein [Streptosporangiaceae bacterium]